MTIIGIDLGTTNSAMAYLKDGKPEIIPNKDGHRTTPSIFSINPQGEIQIGQIAKNAYAGLPNETVLEVKRLMGKDEVVQIGDRTFKPEEISSFYLKYLKESAEIALGTEVTEAVITVPAYFSDAQRKATQVAGRLAGLNVERIINEPTAAAIAFGIENMSSEANILVYDLGGGTFDVSIAEMFGGVVQIKASTGDNTLGGMDFDERLVQWLNKQVKRKNNVDLLNDGSPEEQLQKYARIKTEAEQVKIALSSNKTAQFNLPFLTMHEGMPISVMEEITREEFDDITRDLVENTLKHVDRALEEAKLTIGDIGEVILIGGSTRIPAIQACVEAKFNKSARKDINPDEAVALGAAVQAAIKTGEISQADGLMVIDVCPYSIGTDVTRIVNGEKVRGCFDEILAANTPIPTKNTKIYRTVRDNQSFVTIGVYQHDGVGDFVQDELRVSKEDIILDGVPAGPQGSQAISVTFEYDINGILNVSAEIMSTGKRITSAIDTQTGVMSEAEIKESTRRLEEAWKTSALYNDVKPTMTRAERVLADLTVEAATRVEGILANLRQALQQNNEQEVCRYESELADLLIELV
ncbi:Hsp70 family protein [Caryophanon latum]|uniref:Chaperone protein DnaK n=1 Tax=Caryophanon latum TaxID=33977 RepID=A0A1C0YVE9_9BACL|nr:Hsp70 family protein [Caryophanon latum]OCS91112.1 2-alkenal reductase [Caryophanon latum]